jgi:cytochrome b561
MDRGASLLMGRLVVHAGAALHHQFIQRDGLLQRIWHHRWQICGHPIRLR